MLKEQSQDISQMVLTKYRGISYYRKYIDKVSPLCEYVNGELTTFMILSRKCYFTKLYIHEKNKTKINLTMCSPVTYMIS